MVHDNKTATAIAAGALSRRDALASVLGWGGLAVAVQIASAFPALSEAPAEAGETVAPDHVKKLAEQG